MEACRSRSLTFIPSQSRLFPTGPSRCQAPPKWLSPNEERHSDIDNCYAGKPETQAVLETVFSIS
jgi:hypothetical protein